VLQPALLSGADAPTLYAPAVQSDGAHAIVTFSVDHPGAYDVDYQARRNEIATIAIAYASGDDPPHVAYTADEDELWRAVTEELLPRQRRFAASVFREGSAALALDHDGVPQLGLVSERLSQLTGFRLEPAPGLVPISRFYGSLADRRFLATNFLRHPSMPAFSPEPDMLHEVLGHAHALANPRLASLYELTGHAVRRISQPAAVQMLSRVFWFFLEYGIVREQGERKAYGSSLLSSAGELDQFHTVPCVPLDVAVMGRTPYDVTGFQPLLFEARSFDEVEDVYGRFLEELTDETPERLGLQSDERVPHRPLGQSDY
jgi:phenylalanine-4-hydroxylase